MKEIWKAIPGWNNYEVSNLGNVRSYKISGHFGRSEKPKPKKTGPDRDGYIRVSLYDNGRRRMAIVSTLVLQAFVGPCPKGHEACHNDGDPGNNVRKNLRWDTHVANEMDKIRHDTRPRGETQGSAVKFSYGEIKEIRRLCKKMPQHKVAKKKGVSQSYISTIIRGTHWSLR